MKEKVAKAGSRVNIRGAAITIGSHDGRGEWERTGDTGKQRRGEGERLRPLVVDHNRDLESKDEKIDWRARWERGVCSIFPS